jgi:hypothetical protein
MDVAIWTVGMKQDVPGKSSNLSAESAVWLGLGGEAIKGTSIIYSSTRSGTKSEFRKGKWNIQLICLLMERTVRDRVLICVIEEKSIE